MGFCVGRREVEVLRRRTFEFLDAAMDDLGKGRVDLAAFHAEQALQLALRYLLARDLGTYPHTHDLRELFELFRVLGRRFGSFMRIRIIGMLWRSS